MAKWWAQGIRFKCQGSGKCCSTHGNFGYTYVSLEDRQRLAKALRLTPREFTKKYCQKTDDFFHLINPAHAKACIFLKGHKCTVYHARPTQCKTWPFWPDVLTPRVWQREIAPFCSGVGKGCVVSEEQIRKQMKTQQRTENQLQTEARQRYRKRLTMKKAKPKRKKQHCQYAAVR